MTENIQNSRYDSKNLFKLISPLITNTNSQSTFDAKSHAEFFYNKINNISKEIKIKKENLSSIYPIKQQVFDGDKFDSFELISEHKILSLISKLKNKSCKIDPINTKYIKNKKISEIIAPYLSVLVNNSLQQGIFPDSEK